MIFKVFSTGGNEFRIGIKAEPIPNKFLSQPFAIKMNNSGDLSLKSPDSFEWDDFFRYLKQDCPSIYDRAFSDEDVEEQFEYKILNHIYEQF
ncbi:MAG: hypothetical protein K8R53_00990 [Bacteroidales bacterium]|nr:hypothetical protein [Bacteroidales bacterium]